MSTKAQKLRGRGRPRDDARREPRPANAVKAPQYNLMAAPAWTQPLAAPARDGALDHQQFTSHGYRC